jgi:hypothetical protein
MPLASFVGWQFIALALSGAPADTLPGARFSCDGQSLTAAEIANRRGISLETLDRLARERSLSPADVCSVSEAGLQRALARLAPAPDHPAEALKHRLLDLRDENGHIPHDALMKATAQVAAMKRASQRLGLNAAGITPGTWTALGPGNIGGRVRSLAIHPTSPTTMWTGGVAGGVWKTTNGGTSWVPLDDFMANLAVTTIVLAPGNPDVLYAGTGEGFNNADSIRGAGIFHSANGGTTWTRLAATNNSSFYSVNRLAISPDGSVILAATGTGIHRSINGGTSWTQVHATRTLDVDFHPSDNLKAIASRANGAALYSDDGGVTWLSATVPPSGLRVEVAYARSNPLITYASVELNSGQLWKSTDGGQTYVLVNNGNNYLGTQGWYDNALWVDPTDPDVVIVGGIDLWRSTDGGAGLSRISQWFSAPNSAHADHHTVVAHPGFNGTTNTTVFFGNDGGIYRANNVYTVSLTSGWQELNNNLAITQFYGGAGHVGTGTIVGGTQDNGTLRYRTADGPENWSTMFGGDGGWCASDPTNSNYFYGEYVYLRIHRSTNAGASSGYIYNTPSGITDANNATLCANFISPFVLDPNNADRMLGGACSLWRSNNVKAATPVWAAIKPPLAGPTPSRISAVVVDEGNSDLIYVGHNNGDVYKTVNGTQAAPTWNLVDTGLPNRRVTRITIDRNDPDLVYATFAGFSPDNVWYSTNGGTSWADRTGSGGTGLPDAPVRSLVIHPGRSSWIYAGTEVGVFASEDGGATWSLPHDGPANVSVDELFWMGTTLVAATHGRGMFSVPVPLGQSAAISLTAAAGNVNEPAGSVTVTARIVTSDGLATGAPATVNYATAAGTATAGSDYTATSGTLSFAASTASGSTQTINVPVANDSTVEPSETFTVSLSGASGATLGTPNVHTVTILDDDTTPTLNVPNVSTAEGNAGTTTATFVATLAQALGRPVTVSYATANITAQAGVDYQAASGTLTFAAGETTKSVNVLVNGDTLNELNDTYRVSFTGDAALDATGTITNDDSGPLSTGYYSRNGGGCRILDTRSQPPLFANGVPRNVQVTGLCSVPADAAAVALNLTVLAATDRGSCTLYPTGAPVPVASVINFEAGSARANNAIVPIGGGGQISVQCTILGTIATAHGVIDVVGWFR